MSSNDVAQRVARTRVPHILIGVGLVLVSALILLTSLDHVTIVYSLPPNPTSGEPNRHEELWLPGVAASVLAGAALLVSVGWLILSCLRRPSGRLLILVGVVVLALIAAVVIGGAPMPAF